MASPAITAQGRRIAFLLATLAVLSISSGCNNGGASKKLTNADKKNFMGGPMPDSARQKMAERMAAANAKASAKAGTAPASH